MKNSEMMHLTLSRSDVIRVRQALASIGFSFRDEAKSLETPEECRKDCEDSAEMWFTLCKKVTAQFDLQDVEG